MKNLFSMLTGLGLLLSSYAYADWQGKMVVSGSGMEKATSAVGGMSSGTGKVFARGSKLRVDVQANGQNLIVLADLKASRQTMLMPAQKLAMEIPGSELGDRLGNCLTGDVDACLKKRGFAKTGEESVDGHPCVIWEGTETNSGVTVRQKVWRPKDLKEVFMLKSITHLSDGKEIITEIKDVKVSKLADAWFAVPSGYQSMSMPTLPQLPTGQ